jgi:hypothetical protein
MKIAVSKYKIKDLNSIMRLIMYLSLLAIPFILSLINFHFGTINLLFVYKIHLS